MSARLRLVLLVVVSLGTMSAKAAERTPLKVPLDAVGYEPISNPPGMVVYKDNRSPIIRVAAEAWLPVAPAPVADALLDYEHQVGRIGRLVESRVLARGPNWLRVYQRLALPIVDDRDFTLLVRWGQDGKGVRWITYDTTPDGPPPRSGVVRITHNSGSWQLRPVGAGGTFVRFQVSMDVAGSVPQWMVRGSAGKEIPQLFTSLCQMVHSSDRNAPTCTWNR